MAAKIMLPRRRGLIVNISSWAGRKYIGNAIYGVFKAATDKMTSDMAHELRLYGVAAVSLHPEFTGRVIAALWADPLLSERSGQLLEAAEVACQLGVQDVDGKQPAPFTLETA